MRSSPTVADFPDVTTNLCFESSSEPSSPPYPPLTLPFPPLCNFLFPAGLYFPFTTRSRPWPSYRGRHCVAAFISDVQHVPRPSFGTVLTFPLSSSTQPLRLFLYSFRPFYVPALSCLTARLNLTSPGRHIPSNPPFFASS